MAAQVENNARGVNATQLNIGGTGIGVFNDRIRDAIRGGSPVASETLQHQGIVNGLYYSPNGITPGDESQQREQLLLLTDQIRVGLAGNLAVYELENRNGDVVTGAMIPYGGNQNPTGYTLDPQENIVYAAAHDNETLWDQMILKSPQNLSTEERVRMNNLALSIVGLSQGIPFFHAGDDMLRSKSLDRDSYNSGDWFNKLDFTYQTNNWAVGVPPTRLAIVDVVQPILADDRLAVTQEDITAATAHLRETLAIRTSSPLFTLPTSEAIEQRLTFYNTGPDQIPGVIVMGLSDMPGEDIDPKYDMIVVVFNTTPDTVQFSDPELESMMFSLHPVQAESSDAVGQMSSVADGTFSVPGRTTAVFVTP
jgi:pullulanase-type alpha-1,6-glucosidase